MNHIFISSALAQLQSLSADDQGNRLGEKNQEEKGKNI